MIEYSRKLLFVTGIIIPFCFYALWQYVVSPPKQSVTKDYRFWMLTGILSLTVLLVPLSWHPYLLNRQASGFSSLDILLPTLLNLAFLVFVIVLIHKHHHNNLKHYQRIGAMQLSHEKKMVDIKLEVQEQTFQHISREIHDTISLRLALSRLQLSGLQFSNPAFKHPKINTSISLIGDAIEKLRNISTSLNADLIAEVGLITAVRRELATIQNTGMYLTSFEMTGQPVYLRGDKEVTLYRIIQEALNNILRHATASTISVYFQYTDESLTVFINDDGAGFNCHSIKKGSGMLNMDHRATLLNGSLDIVSTQNGTSVCIKLPIHD